VNAALGRRKRRRSEAAHALHFCTMSSVATIIRSRPVTAFLVLAFTISFVVGIPFNVAASAMFGLSGFWATYLPRVITVVGPALAAILVARAGGGVISVASLGRSLRIPIRHLRCVIPIVFVGVAASVTAFRLAGVPASELLDKGSTAVLALGAHFVVQTAMVGVGEELGWRGWLLPSLARGRTFASATALTGSAWTLWHTPVLFSGVALALSFVSLLVALSIVFAWLWNRAHRTVGIVALAHASVNAPFFWLESAVRARPESGVIVTKAFAYFAAVYVCVAIAVVIRGRNLWLSTISHEASGEVPTTAA
jgi:uncharacterized protein